MKKIIIALLVVVIGVVVWMQFGRNSSETDTSLETDLKTYTSDVYGISFAYPSFYYLEEKDLSTPERKRFDIILTENTEENKDVREGRSIGREGPVSITISLFQNNLDSLSAENFVKNHFGSDYKLATSELTPATKGVLSGIMYRTTGLYEADSFVVSRPDYVYKFSVTYMNTTERIRGDFEDVIKSTVLK